MPDLNLCHFSHHKAMILSGHCAWPPCFSMVPCFCQFTVTHSFKGKINSYGRPWVSVTIHQLYRRTPCIVLAWQPLSWTQIRGSMRTEIISFWKHDFSSPDICNCTVFMAYSQKQNNLNLLVCERKPVLEFYLHSFIWHILLSSQKAIIIERPPINSTSQCNLRHYWELEV